MALEKRWEEVSARSLQQDGGADGKVVLQDTSGFYVKQKVALKDNQNNSLKLEVKRVESSTVLFVGEVGKGINHRTDISLFTTANNSQINATEQPKNEIPSVEHELAVYEREPTVAKRVVNVDKFGNIVDKNNPLDVRLSTGSVHVDSINGDLSVQLTRKDKVDGTPADSVRIGNEDNEAEIDSDKNLHVESHGDDPQNAKAVQPISGVVTSNSTSTPLAANETFVGEFVDCSKYISIAITIFTDQLSAVNGAAIEYSIDGTDAGIIRTLTDTIVPNADGLFISVPCEAKFFRIKYINGTTAQTIFHLETELKVTLTGLATIPLVSPLNDLTSAPLNRSVITGKSVDGAYVNQRAGGVSSQNSTSTPLGIGEIFNGQFENCLGYSNITVLINSDQDSADDGFMIQWSSDGVSVDDEDSYTILGGNGRIYTFGVVAKFFRIVYTNGATAQTNFRLQSILHISRPKPSSHRIDSSISGENDAELVKSVITGKDPNGRFVNESISGVVDDNTTNSLLGAGGVFVGGWVDLENYGGLTVAVDSDVDGTLDIETSSDSVVVNTVINTFSIVGGKSFFTGLSPRRRYARVKYTNGPTAQSMLDLQTMITSDQLGPSSQSIDSPLDGRSIAITSRSVLTGQTPNGGFSNINTQGSVTSNSTITPLDGSAIFRGTWFKWVESYSKLGISVTSDVSGFIFIDFSDEENPVDGDESSVDDNLSYEYQPSVNPLFREQAPVQSKWVRVRFENGNAAQSEFSLTTFLINANPGLTLLQIDTTPIKSQLAGLTRNVPAIPDGNGALQELPVRPDTSNPKQSIEEIHDDIAIKPLNQTRVNQVVTNTTPTRLDPTQVDNRREVSIKNNGPGKAAYGHSSNISFTLNSDTLEVGERVNLTIDNSVEIWGAAENLEGIEDTLIRSGTSATGTATDPSNVLTSDNTKATLDAVGETVEVTGFTAGTTNDIVSVELGIEGLKQSNQFEQVIFIDVVTGTAGNTGTITSGTVTANNEHFYLVEVAWVNNDANITEIDGLGLTWTLVNVASINGAKTAVYYGVGTPTSGTVTASFSLTTNGSVIGVTRFNNVDFSSPIDNSIPLTGSDTSYSGTIDGLAEGNLVVALNSGNRTHEPGSGSIEQHETANGNVTLVTTTRQLATTDAHNFSGTLSNSTAWALVAFTLNPQEAADPIVNLSYEFNDVVGDSDSDLTFSSEVDTTKLVDITQDRVWVPADIGNVDVLVNLQSVGSASLQIDHLFIRIVDTTGNTARFSIWQGGREVSQ